VRIKDWSLYRIYADEGISGKDITGRPAIREMIEDVKSGRVKNVLVFKIDRLTRSTADLIYLVDLFNKYDCAFNSLMESIDTQTASGRMFLKIIGIFAEFERENIIERTKIGVERKVKEGYSLCTAQASFGYDRPKNQKIQTVNESEAAIVREIFEMYVAERVTLIEIARRLNLRGVKTKGGKTWSGTKVRRVLENVNYVGSVRHHIADAKRSAQFDGLHEAIISPNAFDEAQEILARNERIADSKKPTGDEKYFAGFLVCSKCGYRLKTYNTFKQLKTRKLYNYGYVCGNKTLGTCDCGSMSHKKIEAAFDAYLNKIADFEAFDEAILSEGEQIQQDNAAVIAALDGKLRQLETKERETMGLYVSDDVTFDEYREIKRRVASDREAIEAELERLRSVKPAVALSFVDVIANLRENWCLLNDGERRRFLLDFVEKITVVTEKNDGAFFGDVRILDVVWRGW
jgi:site-specific DNA recombinase